MRRIMVYRNIENVYSWSEREAENSNSQCRPMARIQRLDGPWSPVFEAIKDLQDDSEPYHPGVGGLYGHLLPDVPEGLNYAFFTAEMGHPKPLFAWRSKFHDLLYKVDRNQPCRTIKAQPGKFTGPFHWKNRHFKLEELKRLQTFPDDYDIKGSYGTIVEQIGNSVAPRLAFVLATSLKEQCLRSNGALTYMARPFGFQSTFRQRQRDRTHHFKAVARSQIAQAANSSGQKSEATLKREVYYVAATGMFSQSTASSSGAVPPILAPGYTMFASCVKVHIWRCFPSFSNTRTASQRRSYYHRPQEVP